MGFSILFEVKQLYFFILIEIKIIIKILRFLPLVNINSHLNLPLTAYWKALRTGPLKLLHMPIHTQWDSICNNSPDHHLYEIHHDQRLPAASTDFSLHFPCSWCRTDQSTAYFEDISWFKENNLAQWKLSLVIAQVSWEPLSPFYHLFTNKVKQFMHFQTRLVRLCTLKPHSYTAADVE